MVEVLLISFCDVDFLFNLQGDRRPLEKSQKATASHYTLFVKLTEIELLISWLDLETDVDDPCAKAIGKGRTLATGKG